MAKFKSPGEIKTGVVGYGGAFNMGRHHLNEMKLAGMTPTAVCEVDPKRLEVAKTDFPGIETYTDIDELLKKSKVDFITLITPHNTHAPLALKAIKAGKGVVCEKPFAITTAECDAMIKGAKAKKVLLSTYHNRHWDGHILTAMKQIKAGVIGDPFRIDVSMGGYGKPGDWWRTSKSISGGILYDWGVHLLEYSLQILGGSEIAEVTGLSHTGFWAPHTAWKDDTNEDEGQAIVRFSNGKWINLRITTLDTKPLSPWFTITGTQGSYVMEWGNYEIHQIRDGITTITKGRNQDGESAKFYQNIADHLTKDVPLVITPEWARRPIHILDLANQSAKKGAALKAKYK